MTRLPEPKSPNDPGYVKPIRPSFFADPNTVEQDQYEEPSTDLEQYHEGIRRMKALMAKTPKSQPFFKK